MPLLTQFGILQPKQFGFWPVEECSRPGGEQDCGGGVLSENAKIVGTGFAIRVESNVTGNITIAPNDFIKYIHSNIMLFKALI